MLTLTSTLKAAQQSYDVLPVVKVMVSDNPPEVPRMTDLALVWSGSEPDGVNDATWTSDGYLGRCYVDPTTGNVYGQVLAGNHTPTSDFGVWTLLASGQYLGSNGSCCCYGYQDGSKRVAFFWVAASGHAISTLTWTSGSWGAVSTVVDIGVGLGISSLACDCLDPTPRVIYAVSGGVLGEVHWTGSAWSSPVTDGGTWTNPTIAYSYLPTSAPAGDGNGYLLICSGAPQQTVTVKQFAIGTLSWGGIQVVHTYGTGTGYTGTYPKLSEGSGSQRRRVLGWVETGPSPYGAQPIFCFTPKHTVLTDFVPWRYPTNASRGVKILLMSSTSSGGPFWFVVGANQVYRTAADDSAVSPNQRLTFTQDQIESVRIDLPGVHHPARIAVAVSNEGGALSNAGQSGTSGQALRRWSQVVISLGYHTSAGGETVWQTPCWIDQLVFEDDPVSGVPLVVLHCVDCWGLVDQLRFRWTETVTGESAAGVAYALIWRVAGDRTWNPSAEWLNVVLSTYTYRAGESCGLALRHLLDLSGDILTFRTSQSSADGSGWDSAQILTPRWASGGSIYSYQQFLTTESDPTAGVHPILESRLSPFVVPSATSVEVVGSATTSVSRNWTSIWDLWHDLGSRLVDKAQGSQGVTDQVASSQLSYLTPEQWGGEIVTLANVGLELGDQVSVSVPTAPISNLVMTVAGILTVYERGKGLLQTVKLEGTN